MIASWLIATGADRLTAPVVARRGVRAVLMNENNAGCCAYPALARDAFAKAVPRKAAHHRNRVAAVTMQKEAAAQAVLEEKARSMQHDASRQWLPD